MRRLLVIAVAACVVSARAEDTQLAGEHLMGVVIDVKDDVLAIETVDQRRLTVRLLPRTVYEGHDHQATVTDLKRGVRVVVETEGEPAALQARKVRLGVAEPLPTADESPAEAHREAEPEPHADRPASKPSDHSMHTAEDATSAGEEAAPSHEMPHRAEAHGPMAEEREVRRLFQSDMSRMAGMTPEDPMGDTRMSRWKWSVMGLARLGYNDQGGPSGDDVLESSNWNMVMGHRDAGPGRVTLMLMSSLEPGTLSRSGSPELFQTGETFEGKPLVDRQHAHDFVMNLSATFRAPVGERGAYWIHAALRGEPALGPTAFMHRASAGENPTAALGHHQQDATHITDDVLTAGFGWHRISLEASAFHGEEPDEERWDLDPGRLDSYSARLEADLGGGFSAQASRGYLHEPEALEEGDTTRTTASVAYGEAGDGPLAATLLWGHNDEEHGDFTSVLLEGAYQITLMDQVYARAEQADRLEELLRTKELPPEGRAGPEEIATVQALTVGYFRAFPALRKIDWLETGIGADLTAYRFDHDLEPVYGESPLSWHLFTRLRWGRGKGDRGAPEAHH